MAIIFTLQILTGSTGMFKVHTNSKNSFVIMLTYLLVYISLTCYLKYCLNHEPGLLVLPKRSV